MHGEADVVVVGGGLAGLVTAYELEKQGFRVQLLESSERFGGRVATASYGPGLRAEYGMQEIWSKNPLAEIAKELGLELRGEVAFSSVLLDGKVHAFTQDTADAYFKALFTPEEYRAQQTWLRKAEGLWKKRESLTNLQDISFDTWLKEEKLPSRVAEWIRLTIECELGADAESFSALSALDEFRVFLFGGEKALHVEGGNARLTNAIADHLRGPKQLGAKVTRVVHAADKSTVSYLQHNELRTVEAKRVVVAVPWMQLHLIQLDPPLSAERWDALLTLGRGQYTVVHLIIDKGADKLWGSVSPFPVLTRGPLGVIYGITEPSPADQPNEVFSLLIHGNAAREFHMAPHESQRRKVVTELEKLWPGFSAHVQNAFIYPYHPAAIPFWPPGRSPFDERAKLLLTPAEGLYLAGDYLVSSHSEGAVVAAKRQAEAIARELRGGGG
ncbi:MAG: flavin monoamine oxidase family protein [Myxococcaceae bacterium]